MNENLIKTDHQGVVIVGGEKPGGYEEEGSATIVPLVSGEGGFGAPGEYKKYPEMRVVHCNIEKDGVEELGEDTIPEVLFMPSSSVGTLNAPGGEAPAGKAPLSKKGVPVRRKSKSRQNPSEKVSFSGNFGEVEASYEIVSRQDFMLILVASAGSDFVYCPPVSEEPFTVEFCGGTVKAFSSGIKFEMPNTGDKVIVLLLQE